LFLHHSILLKNGKNLDFFWWKSSNEPFSSTSY